MIEHTNRVIFLEDDDVAAVKKNGSKFWTPSFTEDINIVILSLSLALSIHHIRKSKAVAAERELHTIKMQLQEIMKGIPLTDTRQL